MPSFVPQTHSIHPTAGLCPPPGSSKFTNFGGNRAYGAGAYKITPCRHDVRSPSFRQRARSSMPITRKRITLYELTQPTHSRVMDVGPGPVSGQRVRALSPAFTRPGLSAHAIRYCTVHLLKKVLKTQRSWCGHSLSTADNPLVFLCRKRDVNNKSNSNNKPPRPNAGLAVTWPPSPPRGSPSFWPPERSLGGTVRPHFRHRQRQRPHRLRQL